MKTKSEGSHQASTTTREKATTAAQDRQVKCLSFSEVMENQREKAAERKGKPSPWIVRKLAVILVILLWGFTSYVYVGRICVPAILGWSNALSGRATGVGLLVGFALLWLMFVWSYVKIITTPPGFARDHVHESPPPMPDFQSPNPGPGRARPWHNSTTSDIAGPRYVDGGDDTDEDDDPGMTNPSADVSFSSTANAQSVFLDQKKDDDRPSTSSTSQVRSYRTRQGTVSTMREPSPPASNSPRYPQYPAAVHSPTYQQYQPPPPPAPRVVSLPPDLENQSQHLPAPLGHNPGEPHSPTRTAEPDPRTPTAVVFPHVDPTSQHLPPLPQGYQYQPPVPESYYQQGPGDQPGRKPPSHPVLAPEYRYCARDGLIKPMRCHHCRACGTCVLMYDHHCPWIGQCVGAYNRKFFVNFLMWCSLFCLYVLISVIALNAGGPHLEFDGPQIGLIVVAALFALFTTSLFVSHVHLNMYNTSTLERYGISGMQEREKAVLGGMYSIWQIRKRRAQIKQWDREWGKLDTEGNIWWLGSYRQNWEYIMGKNVWGWFLPIGRSQGDGMTYPVNPRFDADGRWRRREDWPKELR